MNLKRKPQPRVTKRGSGIRGSGARRGPAARPRGKMARRPGVPLRRRLAARLPSLGRVLAVVGAAAGTAALVALVTGPWLRVADVSWAGSRYTPAGELERVLDEERGRAILAVDTGAVRERLEALPSVVTATVEAGLTGTLAASVDEPAAAFLWHTPRGLLVGDGDGLLFARFGDEGALPDELEPLPVAVDERREGRLLAVGDRVPAALLRTAIALNRLDPAALGSEATDLSVAVDDDHGFRLRSAQPEWEVAFGVYGLDPRETSTAADARLERQVTAVRTLFASRPEAEIGWVDVRNPGKVYFRAKG